MVYTKKDLDRIAKKSFSMTYDELPVALRLHVIGLAEGKDKDNESNAIKCRNCGKKTRRIKICEECGFNACPSCNPKKSCNNCHSKKMKDLEVIR